ncbi:fimbria/pilus outer membrane usher protein, partial [Escherichia coli]
MFKRVDHAIVIFFSQRGFAPTVRGIANSSAIVTIRQNG